MAMGKKTYLKRVTVTTPVCSTARVDLNRPTTPNPQYNIEGGDKKVEMVLELGSNPEHDKFMTDLSSALRPSVEEAMSRKLTDEEYDKIVNNEVVDGHYLDLSNLIAEETSYPKDANGNFDKSGGPKSKVKTGRILLKLKKNVEGVYKKDVTDNTGKLIHKAGDPYKYDLTITDAKGTKVDVNKITDANGNRAFIGSGSKVAAGFKVAAFILESDKKGKMIKIQTSAKLDSVMLVEPKLITSRNAAAVPAAREGWVAGAGAVATATPAAPAPAQLDPSSVSALDDEPGDDEPAGPPRP